MRFRSLLVAIAVAAVPIVSIAQQGDNRGSDQNDGNDHRHTAPKEAFVDFGVLPMPVDPPTNPPTSVPIGPLPCLQNGAIGGPADPCSYQLHHLTPEEVTIAEGGEVTFQVHGG